MKTLEGVYKAVCLEVDNQGEVVRCQVPQIFNDETVTCFDVAGGIFPEAGDTGWVVFESGFPDHPIWLAGSEGIGSPDVTPGAGVIDITAGNGIGVTGPAQHPTVTNLGVVSIVAGQRVTINNSNPQIPVVTAIPQLPAGGAVNTLLAKNSTTDYDGKWVTPASLGFVAKTGDTMSGQLTMQAAIIMDAPAGGEAIKLTSAADYIGFWNEGTREGYLQGHTNGMSLSADIGYLYLGSASNYVVFPASCRIGVPTVYGSAYGGLSWSNGQYLIMSDGTNSFVSTPSSGGTVFIRGGANGSGISVDSAGTLHGNIIEGSGFNLYGGNSFYFATYGGGWFMQDSQWIRASNNKDVYSAGTFQMGALQCNGGAATGDLTTNYVTTRDGYRFTSNGGYNGGWNNGAYLAQRASTGDRVHYGIHPGGTAKSMGMLPSQGYINFWNEDASWYADLYTNTTTEASQRRGKQDIAPWPPKSAGSAVMGAASRLSLIDVVSFRIKPEMALIQAETMEVHDCDVDDCDGTSAEPCQRVKDWLVPRLGVIVEDLATVLPEVVSLDPEGNPGGMRLGGMIGYLVAVCKEQQERIEALEQNHQEAA